MSAVVDAVMRSNRNVGGNVVEASGTWSVIRGLGLIERPTDLEQVVIGAENGVPIYVRQVATVRIGDAFRAAALVKGTEEAVGGVVVARSGVSTIDVIERVKAKIAALAAGLPAGVRIVPFYDRSDLIERAVQTLKRALIEEALVVTLVNVVFLLHVRSVLIATIPIPLAVLTAFLFMRYLGISSNLMSLAGIAIAIGVLVDAAIVVTENAFRFMEQRGVNPRNRRRVLETVRDATHLVGRPIFFSMAIIILAFIPVFALTGQEGKLFHPLAFTKTFSMVGRHPALGHPGPGAVQPPDRRADPRRGGQPRDAAAGVVLSAGPRLGAPAPAPHPRGGGPGLRRRPRARPPDRHGVHAAAQRGGPHVHAGHGPGDLPHPSGRDHQEAERGDPGGPRGRPGRGQDRPRGHLDGPRAGQHDRDDRAAQAGGPVATGDDPGAAHRRAGCRHDPAGRVEHLDPADHQPDQHAHDRDPLRGRREGLRRRPHGAGGAGPDGRGRAPRDSGGRRRLPRAGHGGALSRHPGEPRGGRPLWDRGRRDPGRDRDRGGGDEPDPDRRGPPAFPGPGPLRGPVPGDPGRARARPGRRAERDADPARASSRRSARSRARR